MPHMSTLPSLMEMMGALIGAPSVSSVSAELDMGNGAVIGHLATWLEDLGFAVEVLPVRGRPGKQNLIATLGSGPGGLVLAGHTDTVPFDAGRWNHDPFQATEADGRIYGLGSCDMKGFFPLAIQAAARFRDARLRAPLIVLATADEESSMSGARDLVRLGRPAARHALIGEPTGLRPVNTHKGILMEAVEIRGRSGHSSDPSLGANALEGMHRALGEILAWREELQRRHRDRRYRVPVPTLNPGRIEGGDNPNRICAHCRLDFDLRPLPGMEPAELHRELDARLTPVGRTPGLELERRPLIEPVPPMHTPADAAIVRAAERLTGHGAEAVAFCTEGPFLNQMGMETVVLGPGDIAQAHQPDEFLSLHRIRPTIDLLESLIVEFCRPA